MRFLSSVVRGLASGINGIYSAVDIQDVFVFCGIGALGYGCFLLWGIGMAFFVSGCVAVSVGLLIEILRMVTDIRVLKDGKRSGD